MYEHKSRNDDKDQSDEESDGDGDSILFLHKSYNLTCIKEHEI